MEVVNSTPVPTDLMVTGDDDRFPRTAIVTAKATFNILSGGKVSVEREAPFGIFNDDEESPWGLLPRDNLPKVDPTFEVLLYGTAHAPGGGPVTQMKVSLAVGDVRREIDVYGDRRWEGTGDGARISAPEPFSEMPLVYENAFGGKRDVLIDVDSPIEFSDPVNPEGKGFNHVDPAEETRRIFKTPEGFPQYDALRELPNLETPDDPIRQWGDEPLVACWTAPPLHSAMLVNRLVEKKRADEEREIRFGEPEVFHRAHPAWVIPVPEARAKVRMDGVHPDGRLEFALPELRVACDIRVGERKASLALVPRSLVLLPEIRRFYLVYRSSFLFPYEPGGERVIRMRGERGWYEA